VEVDMAGNSFGQCLRITTFGESHGVAMGVVIDGCPPGLALAAADVQADLDRRKPGQTAHATPRKEPDQAEILSGLYEGRTTGAPIAILVRNADARPAAYDALKDVYRPGHGDLTYDLKYGVRDPRGGGRASGRETVARVAAGAVARRLLLDHGVAVTAYTVELGGIAAGTFDLAAIDANVLRCPDPTAAVRMTAALAAAKAAGDSLGGVVEVRITGCPPGLGEPVFDKLDADLAKAMMSIGTVKGVEIGDGFQAARSSGSRMNDPLDAGGPRTNHAGGILAGISSGADITVRAACKPIASIAIEQDTIDRQGQPRRISVGGRHDVCVIPRILPVCEAMACLVLADHLLRQRALRGTP
jgi:chorismate synthase